MTKPIKSKDVISMIDCLPICFRSYIDSLMVEYKKERVGEENIIRETDTMQKKDNNSIES